MQWKPNKQPPEKPGEYVCKTNKGRFVIADKKSDSKFLVVKNPHYLRSAEKIDVWLDEEMDSQEIKYNP